MSISGVYGSINVSLPSSASTPAAASDVQVKTLKSQIQDWSTCPTTDPQTKKEKVQILEARLSNVLDGIQKKSGSGGQSSPTTAPTGAANGDAKPPSGTAPTPQGTAPSSPAPTLSGRLSIDLLV